MESFKEFVISEIKESSGAKIDGRKTLCLEELNRPFDLSTPNGVSVEVDLNSLNEPINLLVKVEVRIPISGGEWSGQLGNSEWVPGDEIVPKQPLGNEMAWREIKDQYGIEGIPFNDGEPDFSAVSEASVEIDDFTTDRNANFSQADEACAQAWSEEGKDGKTWTAADVRDYRKENQLSWHERSDQKTMDLVPQVIHGNVPHSGGISAAKRGEME